MCDCPNWLGGLIESTTSRTVNKLVEDGLVIRKLDPKDRRFLNIKLIAKGQKIYENIEKGTEKYYENIFESVPEDKLSELKKTLGEMDL